MTQYLFSYGTLQKIEVQLEIFGRELKGYGDTLDGYRTATVKIEDEAFLARGEQSSQLTAIISNNKSDAIEGSVFEISETELLLADTYEPVGYQRTKVELRSGRSAWIYILAG